MQRDSSAPRDRRQSSPEAGSPARAVFARWGGEGARCRRREPGTSVPGKKAEESESRRDGTIFLTLGLVSRDSRNESRHEGRKVKIPTVPNGREGLIG